MLCVCSVLFFGEGQQWSFLFRAGVAAYLRHSFVLYFIPFLLVLRVLCKLDLS